MSSGIYKRTISRKGICFNTGRTHFKKGFTPWNKGMNGQYYIWPNGRKYSVETLQKLTLINQKNGLKRRGIMSLNMINWKGENHPRWKGGISREYKTGYYSTTYKEWRESVFKRDNYSCRNCGVSGNTYLTAHHIKSFAHFPELRFEISNGLTLCEPCHALTDNYKGRSIMKLTLAI